MCVLVVTARKIKIEKWEPGTTAYIHKNLGDRASYGNLLEINIATEISKYLREQREKCSQCANFGRYWGLREQKGDVEK
jgi:hypothetical protein